MNQDVHLFGDGTFKFCPKYFYHLYSIHAYKNGQCVPCVFFLLPSKTKQCYEQMFRHLTEVCAQFDVTLDIHVTQLNLDSEIVINEAALAHWQNVIIAKLASGEQG